MNVHLSTERTGHDHYDELYRFPDTDVPPYSDTLQTKLKCHCKWGVTVRGGYLTVMSMIDLGPVQSVTTLEIVYRVTGYRVAL